jgi:molybdopterin synthase sulfur carrier subunit
VTCRPSFPWKPRRCREPRPAAVTSTAGTGPPERPASGPEPRCQPAADGSGIRVRLPAQLRELAGLPAEVLVEVSGPVTQRSVLDALEGCYPVLKGTIRDRATAKRRPFVRFYACEEDYSNAAPDDALPDAVACGAQPLFIVGAMAGG